MRTLQTLPYKVIVKRNRLLNFFLFIFISGMSSAVWINILNASSQPDLELMVLGILLTISALYHLYGFLAHKPRYILTDQGMYDFHSKVFSYQTFISWNDCRQSYIMYFNYLYQNSGYFTYISLKHDIAPPTFSSKLRAYFFNNAFKLKVSYLSYPPKKLNDLINTLIQSSPKQRQTEIIQFLAKN